jgi:hypothetical protein
MTQNVRSYRKRYLYIILSNGRMLTSYGDSGSGLLLGNENSVHGGYCLHDKIEKSVTFLGDDIGIGLGKTDEKAIIAALHPDNLPEWMRGMRFYYKYIGLGREGLERYFKRQMS